MKFQHAFSNHRGRAILTAVALLAVAGSSSAATTDIANAPLVASTSSVVRPNVMFVLDDSGSMGWTYMPDTVKNFNGSAKWGRKYGYRSSQCNGVYYNPAITYVPPVDATGTSYADASFTAAHTNGYDASSSTVDLSSAFYASGADSAQPAYYYTYSGSQTSAASKTYYDTSSTFYKECNSVIGNTPGSNVFSKVVVSATSGPGGTDERQNFANWFSYYRTRMLMMKTATGLAFKPIGDNYRVGFMTIHTDSTTTGTGFLDIGTFDATQKANWYSTLYAATPSGSTPLRQALSKAGRIYAGKVGNDPVQYSCQQNFTLLSTDGFWNGSAGTQVDGTTDVGNQDNDSSTAPRPMFDGGSATNASNTLADVAMYYYKTDLRASGATGALGTDVSDNNVPPSGDDVASWQHMTTFTLGLGAPGRMLFSPTYATDTSGDFYNVKNGTFNSASSATPCSWEGKKVQCNWPVPGSNKPENIDDLWHAAVNGRGTYFSATDPSSLATGLAKALSGVSARLGTSAAATTSNPNVSSGDNFVFSSTFTTVDWTGELMRQQIDVQTGKLSTTLDWVVSSCVAPTGYTLGTNACANLLDGRATDSADTRTIYTYDPANGTTNLKPFLWSDLTTAQQADFGTSSNPAPVSTLSQYSTLTAAQQAAAVGANLVNYLRGQRGNEGTLYRHRKHILGDIVSSEAVYVKVPQFDYSDSGYATFKSSNLTRQAMVYVGANDGMLHAFNADTGKEMWDYIPSLILPKLYKLADNNYTNSHEYLVDGTPVVGDVYVGGAWKTILVGGLNGGGRGYYALDITNPASPKALWEFTDDTSAGTGYSSSANLGYTFGNPVITKLKDGTWVVLVSSGYNNVSPGDGQGYLYVLNAASGAIIDAVGTGTGSTGNPSGLGRINAWVDSPSTDNTALRAYGGDLLGNLWRFDINATTPSAQRLATFKGSGGGIQPVTEKPELGAVNGVPVVYVGTGRYLGASDLTDTSGQSFYALKDPLDTTDYGNVRSNSTIVQQKLTTKTDASGAKVRTVTANPVDFASNIGWYIDLPDSGERSTTDPALGLGTLVFTTNVPNSDACSVGGHSWIYYLDYRTGSAVSTADGGGERLGNALATRAVLVRLPNGTVESLTRLSDGSTQANNIPVAPGGTGIKRMSWRELIGQ